MNAHMAKEREVAHFRMDEASRAMAKGQAEKLGISEARFIELIVKFVVQPELMDTWIEMLVAFKKTRRELLKHSKR